MVETDIYFVVCMTENIQKKVGPQYFIAAHQISLTELIQL